MDVQHKLDHATELLRAVAGQVGHAASMKQRDRGMTVKLTENVRRWLEENDDTAPVTADWLEGKCGFRWFGQCLQIFKQMTDPLPAIRLEIKGNSVMGGWVCGQMWSIPEERGAFRRMMVGLGFEGFGGEAWNSAGHGER